MKKCNRQPAATLHGVCREILWAGSNSSQKDGKGLQVHTWINLLGFRQFIDRYRGKEIGPAKPEHFIIMRDGIQPIALQFLFDAAAVQQRTIKRPKLYKRDRIFWVFLSHIWQDWESALIIVKPEIVIKWHRQGFKLYWRWKSRANKAGRPKITKNRTPVL